MKILIATGIYPPEVGGPAYYAENLSDALDDMGHEVRVATYGALKRAPTGIRHALFFFRVIPSVLWSDFIIALDTFSVGLPATLAAKLFSKKIILRTGGDFLWEGYIERTGEKILLSEFYKEKRKLTFKERVIFHFTKWTLRNVSALVFSTEYQRRIFTKAYKLESARTHIIENFYGSPMKGNPPRTKNFVCFVRDLKWKNLDNLRVAFREAKKVRADITLDIRHDLKRREVLERLSNSYAAILVSLGDISPNFVLEALMFGKPIILTKENGISNRVGEHVVSVDPLDTKDIKEKILYLADPEHYDEQKRRALTFGFRHSYEDIAGEFLELADSIKN